MEPTFEYCLLCSTAVEHMLPPHDCLHTITSRIALLSSVRKAVRASDFTAGKSDSLGCKGAATAQAPAAGEALRIFRRDGTTPVATKSSAYLASRNRTRRARCTNDCSHIQCAVKGASSATNARAPQRQARSGALRFAGVRRKLVLVARALLRASGFTRSCNRIPLRPSPP
jgi:hypothetical protein